MVATDKQPRIHYRGFFALLLAPTTIFGIAGWRIAFHLVAIISVILGTLVWSFVMDPRFPISNADLHNTLVGRRSAWQETKELINEARSVIQIRTFQIFVAQGVSGSFPQKALSFVSMWLELMGFGHKETTVRMTIFWFATSLGGLFGRKDWGHASCLFDDIRMPGGSLSQISSKLLVQLCLYQVFCCWGFLMTHLLVSHTALFCSSWAYACHGIVPVQTSMSCVIFSQYFSKSLCCADSSWLACSPIFAETVQEKLRTTIYALDKTFESILASFAPAVVCILAQHLYGYKPDDKGKGVEVDRENAASVAKALYTVIAIPFMTCCSIYSFLYCTYPRDRERERMQYLVQLELRQVELESLRSDDHEGQFEALDLGNDGEGAINDVNYGSNKSIEVDEGAEKLLANRESIEVDEGAEKLLPNREL